MLGMELYDPAGIEADPGMKVEGLGLLGVNTVFNEIKTTLRTTATVVSRSGVFAGMLDKRLDGYQIHTGRTELLGGVSPLLLFEGGVVDGAVSDDGLVWGCYLHGIFENDNFRHEWLRCMGWNDHGRKFERQTAYDRLADHVRSQVDMASIYEMMEQE